MNTIGLLLSAALLGQTGPTPAPPTLFPQTPLPAFAGELPESPGASVPRDIEPSGPAEFGFQGGPVSNEPPLPRFTPNDSTASPPPATLNPLGFPETASPPSTGVEPGRFPSDAAAGTSHDLGSPVPPARAPRALELASIERPSATSAPLLLRQALTPPSQEQALAGKNLPLEEALQGIPETRRRSLVDAYWQLTAAVGRFYFVVAEADALASLPRPNNPADQTMLAGAQLSCVARARGAELAVVRAQFELVAAMAGDYSTRDLPPLPVDLPLVGAYATRHEVFFASGGAPAELERIHLTLPHHLELIDARARAAMAADEEFRAGRAAYAQGQIDVVRLLASYERLTRERSWFLDDLLAYNRDIATYALAVAGGVDNRTLVGMLITRPDAQPVSATQPTGAPTTERPTAEAGRAPSIAQPAPQLAGPSSTSPRWDPAVQPAAAEQPLPAEGELRSVLVQPTPRAAGSGASPNAPDPAIPSPRNVPPSTPRLLPLEPR